MGNPKKKEKHETLGQEKKAPGPENHQQEKNEVGHSQAKRETGK